MENKKTVPVPVCSTSPSLCTKSHAYVMRIESYGYFDATFTVCKHHYPSYTQLVMELGRETAVTVSWT